MRQEVPRTKELRTTVRRELFRRETMRLAILVFLLVMLVGGFVCCVS